MDIENLVTDYPNGSLVATIIKVRSNEATEEFYKKYTMRDICISIEKTVRKEFKHELKRFRVECTFISNSWVYVVFEYSVEGLDNSMRAELEIAVVDLVKLFGYKHKIQYLEDF